MPLRQANLPDLWFTPDGDFLIDGAGDLKDTADSGDRYESLRQHALHRIISEHSGFRLHRNILAGLDRFIGRNIDKQLQERMEYEIHRALTSDGFLVRDEFLIKTMELNPGYMAILIFLNLPDQTKPFISMAWSIQSGEVVRVK